MSLSRVFGPPLLRTAPFLLLVAAPTLLFACIDDSSNPLPTPSRDSGADARPAPTTTPDASRPDDAGDAADAPEPQADGAVSVVGSGVGPGGVFARSQSYTMITRTGGAPGDGQPGASQSYRLFSGLTAATKK